MHDLDIEWEQRVNTLVAEKVHKKYSELVLADAELIKELNQQIHERDTKIAVLSKKLERTNALLEKYENRIGNRYALNELHLVKQELLETQALLHVLVLHPKEKANIRKKLAYNNAKPLAILRESKKKINSVDSE